MANEKIPGIHNYCDRWCERCVFTSRCAIYEDDSDLTPEEKDFNNKAFWDRLSHNFSQTRQMLEQAAAHYGVDLNAPAYREEEYEAQRKRIKEASKDHLLSKLSLKYSLASREWLKSQPGMIERLETLRDDLSMGIESVEAAKTKMEAIKECLSVIQWYQDFIHVKFMRALMGKLRDDGWAEENGFQPDYDGSAKIATIATERSMHAWLSLYQLLPDREDDFLALLGMLEKIKTLAATEFPKAQDFKRPGFDD